MQYVDADGQIAVLMRTGDLVLGPNDVRRVLQEVPEDFAQEVTVQSAIAECDLNQIVKRMLAGTPLPEAQPMQFGDVTGVRDLVEVRQRMIDMKAAFMRYPAEIRQEFGNDVLEFAEALADPAQHGELRELGVLPPLEGETRPAVPAVSKPDGGGDKPA